MQGLSGVCGVCEGAAIAPGVTTKKARPRGRAFRSVRDIAADQALPVALSMAMDTPGPMVELSATLSM